MGLTSVTILIAFGTWLFGKIDDMIVMEKMYNEYCDKMNKEEAEQQKEQDKISGILDEISEPIE